MTQDFTVWICVKYSAGIKWLGKKYQRSDIVTHIYTYLLYPHYLCVYCSDVWDAHGPRGLAAWSLVTINPSYHIPLSHYKIYNNINQHPASLNFMNTAGHKIHDTRTKISTRSENVLIVKLRWGWVFTATSPLRSSSLKCDCALELETKVKWRFAKASIVMCFIAARPFWPLRRHPNFM